MNKVRTKDAMTKDEAIACLLDMWNCKPVGATKVLQAWQKYELFVVAVLNSALTDTEKVQAVSEALDATTRRGCILSGQYLTNN